MKQYKLFAFGTLLGIMVGVCGVLAMRKLRESEEKKYISL